MLSAAFTQRNEEKALAQWIYKKKKILKVSVWQTIEQKRLFIIDGYATLYRAHYALIRNPLTNTAGTPTSAVFGFANQVFQLIKLIN